MYGIPSSMNPFIPPLLRGRLFLILLCGAMCACSEDDHGAVSGEEGTEGIEDKVAEPPQPSIEEVLEGKWRIALFNARQEIFDGLHPIGRATDARFHSLEIKWKDNVRTNREKDILGMAVRYTVFWEGPVNKEGFTKLFSVYDVEVGRIIATDILATNGVTTSEVAEGVGFAIGLGLSAGWEK
jgi:hypothetical protein